MAIVTICSDFGAQENSLDTILYIFLNIIIDYLLL